MSKIPGSKWVGDIKKLREELRPVKILDLRKSSWAFRATGSFLNHRW